MSGKGSSGAVRLALAAHRRAVTAKEATVQPLRRWRTQQLLSIRDLAIAAGITPKSLTDLEYGRRRPNFATMRRVSQALGVDPHEIAEFAATLERRGSLRDDATTDEPRADLHT
jgi:transcriptional regulator with XRE-family HTH domain